MNKIKLQINISKQVHRILEDKMIKPTPRWCFVLQEYGIWVLGIGATIFGAVTFSTVLFVLATAPFKYQTITHENSFMFWIEILPLLWMILFVCFIFATDFFLKKTKRGYKHSFIMVTLSSLTVSIVLGYAAFTGGIGEMIEEDFGQRIPFHTPMHMKARSMWSDLDHGLITGRLGESESVFITLQGKTFVLNIDELPDVQKNILNTEDLFGLIGTSTAPNIFVVCAIIPFEKPDFKIGPTQFERNELEERTNLCKGVRPYVRLKSNFE